MILVVIIVAMAIGAAIESARRFAVDLSGPRCHFDRHLCADVFRAAGNGA